MARIILRNGGRVDTLKGAARHLVADALEQRPGPAPLLAAVTAARHALQDALAGRPERPG